MVLTVQYSNNITINYILLTFILYIDNESDKNIRYV